MKLKTNECILYKCFKKSSIFVCTEIKLLKKMLDIPSGTSFQIIHDWLDWLKNSNRISILFYFFKAL